MVTRETAPGLDDLLLDVATVIELSDNDREVAEGRYRQLKVHLERPSSVLRPHLLNDRSLIYPQGSMAISSTIVSGTEDERFDVDALVEMQVPADWLDGDVLDNLLDSLQGFPGAEEIVRCTRCVQLRFASMHMDVAVLDPAAGSQIPRAGEIFHSPDFGDAYRVPANPFGFADWYRRNVRYASKSFIEQLQKRRQGYGVDRLGLSLVEKAQQIDLPPLVPPRLDAQQVVALKLMKRFLYLRYEDREVRRPPSIYITKLSQTCGFDDGGLTAQIERLAILVKAQMERAIGDKSWPDERNPSYPQDRLNDRWPMVQGDCFTLAEDMDMLLDGLRAARRMEFADIAVVLADLFGERVSKRTMKVFAERLDERHGLGASRFERGTGAVIASTALAAPAVARATSPIPRHSFHCGPSPKKK